MPTNNDSTRPSRGNSLTSTAHSHESSQMKDLEAQDHPGALHDNSANNEKAEKPFSSDDYLVDWDGPDDPENPQNWTFRAKVVMTAVLSFICLVCTFASSIFSTGQTAAGIEFGVGAEVMELGKEAQWMSC